MLKVVANQHIYDEYKALLRQMVKPSFHTRGAYDGESLRNFQMVANRLGYCEAEIVKSNYGYSVRYASGLQNFGLIFSARAKQVDGTLEDAIKAATRWASEKPMRRFVTMHEGER